MATVIRNKTVYDKSTYREHFEAEGRDINLEVYIKSKGIIYDVPCVGEALCEKEEFCAGRFDFYVLKDDVISFNQGDAVSVKYNGEGVFYGYVFKKSRDKMGLIKVCCYDQMRYLKNRRTYTRGRMNLGEIVRCIAEDNNLKIGECDKTQVVLPSVMAQSVSLLDVVKKAVKDTENLSGKKYIFYDDFGYLYLKDEEKMSVPVLIDESGAENFVYTDSIDKDVYNMIEIYKDTKRANLRTLYTVSDKESMNAWGTLILSKKATDENLASQEGAALLKKYNKVNREIVLKGVVGDIRFIPGASIWVKLTMGDLEIDGYVRIKKAVHRFADNFYCTDLYLEGDF